MKNNNEKSSTMGKVVTISAGVAALAASGYFFWGPDGKKNRHKTRGWMIKMKGDVVEKLETMQDISKEAYDTVVDTVSGAYETATDSKEEVEKLARELKSHWKAISKKAMSKGKKVANKVARKIVSKTNKPRS